MVGSGRSASGELVSFVDVVRVVVTAQELARLVEVLLEYVHRFPIIFRSHLSLVGRAGKKKEKIFDVAGCTCVLKNRKNYEVLRFWCFCAL